MQKLLPFLIVFAMLTTVGINNVLAQPVMPPDSGTTTPPTDPGTTTPPTDPAPSPATEPAPAPDPIALVAECLDGFDVEKGYNGEVGVYVGIQRVGVIKLIVNGDPLKPEVLKDSIYVLIDKNGRSTQMSGFFTSPMFCKTLGHKLGLPEEQSFTWDEKTMMRFRARNADGTYGKWLMVMHVDVNAPKLEVAKPAESENATTVNKSNGG